jgi:hypothetical protein
MLWIIYQLHTSGKGYVKMKDFYSSNIWHGMAQHNRANLLWVNISVSQIAVPYYKYYHTALLLSLDIFSTSIVNNRNDILLIFKGTVSRDFLLQVLWMRSSQVWMRSSQFVDEI